MCLFIIIFLFVSYLVARIYESGTHRDLYAMWRSASRPAKWVAILTVVVFTQYGGTKGISPMTKLFTVLLWNPTDVWELYTPHEQVRQAESNITQTVSNAAFVSNAVATHSVATLSFDWSARERLPYRDEQNVLAWSCAVIPTNIDGTLYEDHFVEFNATASTNPAVILIEYARTLDDGSVERYAQKVVTNSYPRTSVVNLQSGSHTCYWFRCQVPEAFTNSVRDWNGEALFGSPEGSGHGFDLLGTLVIDNGNQVWLGATTNIVIGGITNAVQNGIFMEAKQ